MLMYYPRKTKQDALVFIMNLVARVSTYLIFLFIRDLNCNECDLIRNVFSRNQTFLPEDKFFQIIATIFSFSVMMRFPFLQSFCLLQFFFISKFTVA